MRSTIISDTTPDELLRQDTLTQQGIREPLYVTAMKYAGIDLTQVSHLDKLAEVSGETVLPKMTQWSVNLVQLVQSKELNYYVWNKCPINMIVTVKKC